MTTTDYTIYSIARCKYCELAKELLREHGQGFHDVAVDMKLDLAVELIEQTGSKTWPKIFHKGEFIGGYTELRKTME